MKTSIKIFALGTLMIGFALNANAQDNTTADATATVKKSLTIAKTADLSFGTFSGLALATSDVTVGTTGGRSGSADLLGNDGVAAKFTITGEAGGIVAITFPSETTNLVDQGSGDGFVAGSNMTIAPASWQADVTNIAAVTLDGGNKNINVGATLAIGINQKAGSYKGTFAVSVNYN